MTGIITLLTDFGTADGYVGELKGVLATLAPDAQVVDVAHDLAAHDVDAARLAVARYWRRFPPGTVHLVVVDPGVGGARAALAVGCDGRFLVGPDNGVLSPALLHPEVQCVSLLVPPGASATFHGRDVFAPAAAALAGGAALGSLGSPVATPVVRRTPEPIRLADGRIEGEVIGIDRFGNAVTNLMAMRGGTIHVAGMELPVRRTYGDAPEGSALAVLGSSGLLEIAVRDGRAADRLGVRRGDRIVFQPAG